MTTAAGMPCPICKAALVMSERQGVEIDYCPQCRGVWLDRGELDKIIERSAQEIAPAAPPSPPGYQPEPSRYPQQHGSGHKHGYYPKRKKSFLEELFD
jgi:Zn-finger nucleic acid-binding protein